MVEELGYNWYLCIPHKPDFATHYFIQYEHIEKWTMTFSVEMLWNNPLYTVYMY